jgi:PKD repeat protein/C1A family cysteine protease
MNSSYSAYRSMITLMVFGVTLMWGIQAQAQKGHSRAPLDPEFEEYMNQRKSGISGYISQKGYFMGDIPMPVKPVILSDRDVTLKAFVPRYDLREEGGVTSVKDQGQCGSCWTFTAMGAVESAWLLTGYGTYDLSEDNMNNCHTYDWLSCEGGNLLMAAGMLAGGNGPMYELDDPYSGASDSSCPLGLEPAAYVPDVWFLDTRRSVIKQAIMDYGGVYASTYFQYDAYYESDYTYYYEGPGDGSDGGGGHAVLVVGWDDEKVTAADEPGAWIVKNSWGTAWGEAGYYYMSYYDGAGIESAGVFPNRMEYDAAAILHEHDEMGWMSMVGFNDGVDDALAKFTTEFDQQIEYVGTYAISSNAVIDVEVYDDFDGESLSNLLSERRGLTCSFSGYHTFRLSDPVFVPGGDDVYIRITYQTNTDYPIPVERVIPGYSSEASISDSGSCWISSDGQVWEALGADIPGNEYDLCIKAWGFAEEVAIRANFSAEPTSGYAPLEVLFTDGSVGSVTTWSWDFDGDGQSDATVKNPTYEYTNPGLYNVRLIVGDGMSSDTLLRENYIEVFEGLSASFTGSPTSGYAPLSVTFTDASSGDVTTWSWDFDGDGQSDATVQNPTYEYTNPGLYDVRLIVGDDVSYDTLLREHYIEVNQGLSASFTGTPTNGYAPLDVSFSDASSGDVTTWSWDFDGDGQSDATVQNPTFEYTEPGLYDVRLIVGDGVSYDTLLRENYIEVQEGLSASFTGAPTSGYVPLSVNFTDASSGDVTTWSWDFDGDGQSDATVQNPTYEYTDPGLYDIRLIVGDGMSFDTLLREHYIEVFEGLSASFTGAPTNGYAPLDVSFSDASSGDVTTWSWDFDGDGQEDATDQNPTCEYTDLGLYDVRLIVGDGVSYDTLLRENYIEVFEGLSASFTGDPTSGYAPLTISFSDASAGAVTTWVWDFDGDGQEDATDQNPTYEYTNPGLYDVRLIVGDGVSSDTLLREHYIEVNQGLSASFTGTPTNGYAPLSVSFSDASAGAITTWSWDFDGDDQADATSQNPTYEYTDPGLYDVRLIVGDGMSSDTLLRENYIEVNEGLSASFTGAPTSGYAPLTISFSDASAGAVTTWVWDFDGDGQEDATDQNPTYEYTNPGLYDVRLIVGDGVSYDTLLREHYIEVNQGLSASFTGTPTNGYAPLEVSFSDASSGDVTTWSWDFDGDGQVDDTDQNPTFEYTEPGLYDVSLVIGVGEMRDTLIRESYITAEQPVSANFEADVTTGTVPLTVNFQDLSKGEIVSWKWDLDGDGTWDDTHQNTSHTYDVAGTYSVTLEVTDGVQTQSKSRVDYITVEEETSLEELLAGERLVVYPNPVTDRAIIHVGEDYRIEKVILTRLDGQVMATWANPDIRNSRISLGLSSYAQGVYLLNIQLENEVVTVRLVKE